jgi:hypothetical protein
MARAQALLHATCWNGTHVFPRYGFLKVITCRKIRNIKKKVLI